jgi:hypothetical protein
MQRHFHDELEALKQTLLAMGGWWRTRSAG